MAALSPSEVEDLRALARLGQRPGALFHAISKAVFSRRIATLWPEVRPVRLVGFDTSESANWGVPL